VQFEFDPGYLKYLLVAAFGAALISKPGSVNSKYLIYDLS
jgi:hypothetical protein